MPTRSVLRWVLELAVRPTPDMDMVTGMVRRPVLTATTAMHLIHAPRTVTTVLTGSLAASSLALVPGSAAATTGAATTAEATAIMAGAATMAVAVITVAADIMAAGGCESTVQAGLLGIF